METSEKKNSYETMGFMQIKELYCFIDGQLRVTNVWEEVRTAEIWKQSSRCSRMSSNHNLRD